MKRWLLVFTALSLLLLVILPACGGGGEEETASPTPIATSTSVLTATPTATLTPTATPTPAPSGPVKIGAIQPWSGPMAMAGTAMADPVIKLVEWQVKQQGGILGGRELDVVRYDNRASVPESQAGVKKLYYEDNVSAVVFGGASIPEFDASASAAEELKILFVSIAAVDNLAELKFSVNASAPRESTRQNAIILISKVLKANTVAFLGADSEDGHVNWSAVKAALEAAGVKVVYEDYAPLDTTDYSPYLTKIKYANPDVLYTYHPASEFYLTIAKQIMEQGGWGDIKFMGQTGAENAKKLPGAQGWYVSTTYAPGADYPGATKFFSDYQTVNGRQPAASQIYYYNCLWTAIYAMELAGTDTDRVAIAQAARSGKLEWDTPMGHAHFMPDGTSGLGLMVERIEEGNFVYIPLPGQ